MPIQCEDKKTFAVRENTSGRPLAVHGVPVTPSQALVMPAVPVPPNAEQIAGQNMAGQSGQSL